MTATFVDITTRIPNNAPLTYSQVDTNFTNLQHNMPVGAYIDYPVNDDIPPTWLECDGSELDQTVYSALYNVIGTTFNTGGETAGHFRVPDTRGYFSRHLDTTQGVDPNGSGRTPGDIQADEVRYHNHSVDFSETSGAAYYQPTAVLGDTLTKRSTSNYGGDETRPKNLSVIRLIKAISVVPV